MLAFRSRSLRLLHQPRRVHPGWVSPKDARGFTFAELLVVVGVIAFLTAMATPFILSFLQGQQVRGAAQYVATLLNQARHLAIARNASFRAEVDVAGNQLRFVCISTNCTNPAQNNPWLGPGTDSNGWIRLDNQFRLTSATANVTFGSLGNATTAGTIGVQGAQGSSSLSVVVSVSGRIRIE